MFLVGAGLAFGNSRRKYNGPDDPRHARRQRAVSAVRRAFFLLALGVYLQLPGGSIHRAWSDAALWDRAVAVGPLQLIAACLLLSAAIHEVFPGRRGTWTAHALWLLLALGLAPLFWSSRASMHLPAVWGTWLDGTRGSTFPFFPWSAFFAAGVLGAEAVTPGASARSAFAVLTRGAALMGGALLLHCAQLIPLHGELYWHAGAPYFLFRTGACLVVLGVLLWLKTRHAVSRLPLPIGLLARHSLTAYVAHLLVLYGSPYSRGLVHFARSVPLAEGSALTALVLGVSLLACYITHSLKSRRASPASPLAAPGHTQGL
jgi:uncharacterized membrane protein